MDTISVILEIAKYTTPALIVFFTAYFTLTAYMRKEAAEKVIELKMKRDKEIIMLRLQAYERLALFLERIAFISVIERVRTPEMNAASLQYAVAQTIQDEYEYNLSQQIYVSPSLWKLITQSKDEMIKTVNLIGGQVPSESSAGQFINVLLSGIKNANAAMPNEQALDFLKAECKELF